MTPSSMEDKYAALAEGAKEGLLVSFFLSFMQPKPETCDIEIQEDNDGGKAMAETPLIFWAQ